MMIGMTIDLTIKAGSGPEFERAFAIQAAAVRANEPGNILYALFRSRVAPDSYTLVEIYEDAAALAAHQNSPHMAANRPLTLPFLAGRPKTRAFDVASHIA